MIVYQANKTQFISDVFSNDIENIVLNNVRRKLNRGAGASEIKSWANSLGFMERIMRDEQIPSDCGIAIEYQIPQTGKRIDFIISGQDPDNKDSVMLIELKQWSEANLTNKDSIVETYVGGRIGEHTHPSYQAWSYATLLQGFNEVVYTENISLHPCAYLHNYVEDNVIKNEFYADYISKAPVFLKSDAHKLSEFIKKHIRYGDKSNILYRIENGRIRPSKLLADSVSKMLKGNQEFVMIDDQKVVYENAVALACKASAQKKQVLIVQGGPGTGKSVVAINLLVALTQKGLLSKYVSKNAAPRAVYESKLKGNATGSEIRNFFGGSGAFIDTKNSEFDALIIDEAHRLNKFSGLFGNLGENQIKEIIDATKFAVFFIDEDQRVTLKDIGRQEEIEKWAYKAGAEVTEMALSSQFRCNGSDGYLSWLDNTLQINETANNLFEEIDYDFKVVDSPSELKRIIVEKNKVNNRSRIVAGYCWKWPSKKNPSAYDIEFPEYDFRMKWNLTEEGSKWIISPDSVNQIGCIHTCQGLEVDYIGVIIGEDLIVRNGQVITDASKRASSDNSVKGYKKMLKENPTEAANTLDLIIKNTYRTLMTRGMKGCYIYCVDKETAEYFKEQLAVKY
ncbi:MAG: DNA/RNA helicase domain-containing protein [Sediminibacterium sp.]